MWLPSCCASSLLGVEADGCAPVEVGPGAWLKMTQDKTRQDEPQVSGGLRCGLLELAVKGLKQRLSSAQG